MKSPCSRSIQVELGEVEGLWSVLQLLQQTLAEYLNVEQQAHWLLMWKETNQIFKYFFICHIHNYIEYITSSEMYSLHLTHPKWTHTRSSGQPCYSARGAVGGSVPCSRTPQSWYWRRILPPPTIPAGPEIRTHNLPLTSPTRYPLGHDCPRPQLRHVDNVIISDWVWSYIVLVNYNWANHNLYGKL